MISRQRKLACSITLLLAFALSQIGASASAPLTGRLRTRANKPVTVNGNKVVSGATILSGAQVESPEGVGATIEIALLGRIDIAPKTELTITFAAGSIDVQLKAGYVVLTTKKGTDGTVTTPDGKVARTDSSKLSSVIARTPGSEGPEAAARVGATSGGMGGGGTAAVVAGAGAAVVGGVAASKKSGRGSSVSPTTPRGQQ
ncbi:MAG: hypothetical protein WCB68_00650 [Pyrinomonadaceae bacterium]